MDYQIVKLYKMVLKERGKVAWWKHISPGRMDIDVTILLYGVATTSTCTIGDNDLVCLCGTFNCDFDDDHWNDASYCHWDWDEEEARWDKLLGKRPTENWDE